MASPLSELRTILRILNKWPSTRPRDSIWKTYLREEYRRSAADAASLEALRRRARDYANLLDGVEEKVADGEAAVACIVYPLDPLRLAVYSVPVTVAISSPKEHSLVVAKVAEVKLKAHPANLHNISPISHI